MLRRVSISCQYCALRVGYLDTCPFTLVDPASPWIRRIAMEIGASPKVISRTSHGQISTNGMYLLIVVMDIMSQSWRKNPSATTSAIILFASSLNLSLAAAHIINQSIALASDLLT